MSGYDFFHNLFGNGHGGKGSPPDFGSDDNVGFNKPNGPGSNPGFENDDMKFFSSIFDFKMMNDPFEMHRAFEEKVNEMMKSFMSHEGFPGIQGFGIQGFEPPDVPAITEKENPRDHYLKPGAKKPSPSPPAGANEDERSGPPKSWLGQLIPSPGQEWKPTQPNTFSSFRSVIRKTVTLPDGTVKTEEIIRNSDGTEEKTESQSKSDGNIMPFSGSPFVGPDFSGLFNPVEVPKMKDPRYQLLRPGYEKLNPLGEKIDKDLDKQIEQSGIESLPPFTKEPEVIHPNVNQSIKSFTRRTVTLPNGAVETEEIIRNPDGTEQRTVTQTMPDGSTKPLTDPVLDSFVTGPKKSVLTEGYDKPDLSFALRGVKDFIDMLFK